MLRFGWNLEVPLVVWLFLCWSKREFRVKGQRQKRKVATLGRKARAGQHRQSI